LGQPEAAESSASGKAAVELVEMKLPGVGQRSAGVFQEPIAVTIGERFRIEVVGDFESRVLEKLVLALSQAADRLS
jgi:hypothetical protein